MSKVDFDLTYRDYTLEIRPHGCTDCVNVRLLKREEQLRKFELNTVSIAGLIAHWHEGIDTMERLQLS